MRLATQTDLSPDDVIERAQRFFGEGGELGLLQSQGGPGNVTFTASDGGVSVSATADNGKTEVTILSREYDHWAERFLHELH